MAGIILMVFIGGFLVLFAYALFARAIDLLQWIMNNFLLAWLIAALLFLIIGFASLECK